MSNPGFMRACAYSWGGLATIIFFCGVVLAMIDPNNLTRQLTAASMIIKEDTLGMKMWISPPTPMIFKVYFWNVTNPREVIGGARPKLAEVGPYVYEKWMKKVQTVMEDNDTVAYKEHDKWVFNDELTGQLQETDVVTIVHLPILGMILRVNEIAPEFVGYLDDVWTSLFPTADDIFMTGTVRDILFDGIPIDCHSKDFMVTAVCNNLEEGSSDTIRKVRNKEFKFSYFDYKRSITRYTMRVYRGIEDITRVKQTVSFNNQVSLNKWHNKYCDMLNGSDGSQFPPNLKPEDVVYMFQPDLCRSMYARFEQEMYYDTLKVYRFVNTADLFASAKENPDNECFCAPKAQLSDFIAGGGQEVEDVDEEPPPKTCLESGAMLLTPCIGAPVTVTFPHFYLADKSFLEYVALTPSQELHGTFVDVEPLTGIPVRGSKKIQFNIEMKPIPEMRLMSNLTPGFFPILWVDESMVIPNEGVVILRRVQWINGNVNTMGYIIAILAGILVLTVAVCYKKASSSGIWDASSNAEEPHAHNNHGYGVHGLYTNRTKLAVNGKGNGQVKATGRVPDYPLLLRRNGGRVYPNTPSTISGLYSDNFM